MVDVSTSSSYAGHTFGPGDQHEILVYHVDNDAFLSCIATRKLNADSTDFDTRHISSRFAFSQTGGAIDKCISDFEEMICMQEIA